MMYIILYIIYIITIYHLLCVIYMHITILLSLCYTDNTNPYSTACFVSCCANKQLVYRNTKTNSVNRLLMNDK